MSTTSGIDIGSDSIKAVVLKAGKSGPVEVVAAGAMPIADIGRLPESEDKTLAIGEKLRQLVKSARLKADTRRVGASGPDTSIRYLQIPPLPPWRLEMLVKYEVEERAEEKETNAFDYHIMDVPETNGQYTVIIGMAKEVYVRQMLAISRSSGLGEVEIDLEALALFSAYYHGHGYDPDKTVAIADIGADDVTILICRNGSLYYARTVLGGGRRFTQNLADELKVEFSEAEELKKNKGEIVFDITPAASSGPRIARIQRTGAGASGVLPRAPGASQAGAIAGGPAATSDEARRSRIGEAARLAGKSGPGNPAASRARPGVPGAAEGEVPTAAPAQSGAKRPMISMSAGLGLDDLDLSQYPTQADAPKSPPIPAVQSPSAPSPIPVPPPAPSLAPKASAPVDELELQLEMDEKPAGPVANQAPLPPSGPGGTRILSNPGARPAPTLPSSKPKVPDADTIELMPSGDLEPPPAANAGVRTTILPAPTFPAANEDGDVAPGVPPEAIDDRERRKRMSAALVREAASLCAGIENVILSAKTQAKLPQLKIDRLYLTGGSSKLKGLSEFMGRRLRVEIAPLEPFRNLSLDRLPPGAAAALKAEQHTWSVALGLALSDLRAGAHSFLIWPQALKQRKVFWARGAYLYYAAGAAALAMGVMLYTPYRNTQALVENASIAEGASREADKQNSEVRELDKVNNELRHRLTTITDNVQSGDFFLNVLSELKNKQRIKDDIYLTSISTSLPFAVLAEAGDSANKIDATKTLADQKAELKKSSELNKEPDTFQAQRRIFIRGFARGPQREFLNEKIQDFYKNLVRYPDDPDNPQNVFKDIRPIFLSKEDFQVGKYWLKEFVLEAFTDKPAATPAAPAAPAVPGKGGKQPKGKAAPAAPTAVAPQPVPPALGQVPPIAVPTTPQLRPAQVPVIVTPGLPPVANPAAPVTPPPPVVLRPAPVGGPGPGPGPGPVPAPVPVQDRSALGDAWKKLFDQNNQPPPVPVPVTVQPLQPPIAPPVIAPQAPVPPPADAVPQPKKKREFVAPADVPK